MKNAIVFFAGTFLLFLTLITLVSFAVHMHVFLYNPSFYDTQRLPDTQTQLIIVGLSLCLVFGALCWKGAFVWGHRKRIALALSGLLVAGGILHGGLFALSSAYRSQPEPVETQMLILGLDAANEALLDPWIEAGHLPTIQRLREQSASYVLTSMEPMRSPALWTTIATGRSPEVHGVSGFFATRHDIQAPRIFDVAMADGMRVGLFQWLVTWPVVDLFDVIVPAWMARSPDTWPKRYVPLQEFMLEQDRSGSSPDLSETIEDMLWAGARASTVRSMQRMLLQRNEANSEEKQMALKMTAEVTLQTDVFLHALDTQPLDLASFILYGSDKLGHRLWHYMEPQSFPDHDFPDDESLTHALRDYYIAADRAFARILSWMPKDCRVVLLSDHGMKADPGMPGQFFLNMDDLLADLHLEQGVVATTMMRSFLLRAAENQTIDWKPYRDALEAVLWQQTGEPLFLVEPQEDGLQVRTNLSLTAHPESPFASDDLVLVGGEPVPVSRYFFARYFSGTHDLEGVLMLSGPGVNPGRHDDPVGVLDIAPTLLYWLGLPISDELEGTIVDSAFTAEYRTNHAVKKVSSYPSIETLSVVPEGDDGGLKDRLRSVGYL